MVQKVGMPCGRDHQNEQIAKKCSENAGREGREGGSGGRETDKICLEGICRYSMWLVANKNGERNGGREGSEGKL